MVQGALDPVGRLNIGKFRTLGALLLLMVGGCEGPGSVPGTAGEEGELFPGSAPTLERLGRDVVSALVRGDTAALERVRLSEREHNEVVWPELPASAPEVNFPVDLAWENIQARNRRDLGRILPWYRDGDVEYEGVECRGGLETFETFRVHTDCFVTLRSSEHGVLEAQLFEDALERGGGFKVFRYYDTRPESRVDG